MQLLRGSRWILVLLLIGLTLLAPSEQSLGAVARLIYLHAALVWTAFILIMLTGLCAIAAMWRQTLRPWTSALLRASLVIMTVNVLLVPIVTKLTWGLYFAWREPRVFLTFFLFALTWGVYLLQDSIEGCTTRQILMVVPAAALGILLVRTGRVLHPVDPIGSSESLAIKLFPLVMLATGLVLGFLWTISFRQLDQNKE